jgi:hypothetical protein
VGDEQQAGPVIRRRLNVSSSVKGIRTADFTVEITGGTEDEFWAHFNSFADAVDKAYPPPALEVK